MKCAAWMRRSVNPHPLTTAPHGPKLKADAPFDERCWTDSQPRKEAAMRHCWTVALLVVVVASSACAMAYAQSGRASYVGRWAARRGAGTSQTLCSRRGAWKEMRTLVDLIEFVVAQAGGTLR
jgi:hypothetical protein